MFNFIFEGKIGEMLAPVSGPTSQLLLAVQHHRNEDMRNIIETTGLDLGKSGDGGYSAIHVAARYDNRYALEFILSRGLVTSV